MMIKKKGFTILFSFFAFNMFFCQACADDDVKVKLELKTFSTDRLIYTPLDIEFQLTNLTDKTISNIMEIDYREPLRGIKIFVIFNGVKKEIIKPVLSDIDESNTPRRTDFDLSPGESAVFRHSLIQDWAFDVPFIFSTPGIYTVYGTHPVPGYGIIESNRVEIEYRGPITKNEIEAVNLLKPFSDYLQYIYNPLQLFSVRDVNLIHNFVKTIRKTYELESPIPFKKYMREALIQWKKDEIDTIKMDIYSWKMKKIHKLGLQDLDLGEK